MIEMHTVRPGELPQVKELWQTVFGDSAEVVDSFYRTSGVTDADTLVLAEGGEVRCMLYLLPMPLTWPGDSARGGYVFALATRPEHRGRGYAGMLLSYADFYAGEIGLECAAVVPAEESLHTFFKKNGFKECFTTRVSEFAACALPDPGAGDAIAPVDAGDYNELREKLLLDERHVSYPDGLIAFQKAVSKMSGADLYRLTVDGQTAVLAAERLSGGRVLVKELAGAAPERAAALLRTVLPAERYTVRTPAAGEDRAFGMVKWYRAGKERFWGEDTPGYLGLAFD